MTGPHRRENPDAERRTQERRDEQTRPPRMPPGWPASPSGRRQPTPVHIVSAADEFFAGFNRQTGAGGEPLDPAHGFRSVISDQRAMAQSVRQVTDELRRAVDMAQQFSLATRDTLVAQREARERDNREQTEHMRRVLDAIEQVLTRQAGHEEEARRRGRAPTDDDRRPAGPDDDLPNLDDLPGGPGPGGRHRRDEGPAGRRRRDPLRPPGSFGDDRWDRDAPDSYGPGYGPQRSPEDLARARRHDTEQEAADRRITDLRGRPRPNAPRSRHELRRRAEQGLAEAIHQRYGEGEGGEGTLLPQYDENGEISHHIYRRAGQEDEIIQNDDARLPGLLRMAGRQGMVSRLASGLNLGGLGGMARSVPVVGWALAAADAANQGARWVTEQNRQSSFYQGIYAGDSKYGGDALGQRLQEEGFVWSNRFSALSGGLTEEDARAAFKGVSQLGYKDSTRTDALEFIQRQYADLGVNVQTSLKLVEMSAKGANSQLAGLDKALSNVGTMARQTGQNANVLYEAFAQNYQLALGMSLGASAPSMAASLTQLTAGTSRDLSNINYAPLASETSRRIMGSISGHSYSWLEAQYQLGNTEPYTQAVDRKNAAAYRGALAGQGAVGSTIQDEINRRGGIDKVKGDKGAWRDIALAAMQAPGADPENLKRYLTAQGVEDVSGLTDEQVYERVVQHQLGADNLTDAVGQNKEQFNQKNLRGGEAYEEKNEGFLWLNKVGGSDFVRQNWSTAVSGNPWLKMFGWGGEATKNDALSAYRDRQQGISSGGAGRDKSDPVIESLITKLGKDQNVGIKVQTGKGEKVVSLSDAITYYPDQLTSGKATIVGGDDPSLDGQSIESIVGGKEGATGDADTTKSTDEHGESEDDWRKDHPSTGTSDDKSGTSGKITLDMSDELKRWFSATVSGAVTDSGTEAGASSAVPPTVSGGLPR